MSGHGVGASEATTSCVHVTVVDDGARYADLDARQRDALRRLVDVYTGRPPRPLAFDLRAASFAWLGATEPGLGHYYAIRAGSTLIELDNTQNGANHVHTVIRDVERDWGEYLLASHYATGHR